MLGPPYRCVPLETVPGQFSRLGLDPDNASAFVVQYTPCQGLPPYASWTAGPHPSFCFFQCNYAVEGPVGRQYLFYYSMERPDPLTQSVLQFLGVRGNVFPLDYPGLAVDLMLMASQTCLPCPNTQCEWGLWRPMKEGCGPPVCSKKEPCQVMEAGPVQYTNDGCLLRCSYPDNAHLTGLAATGLENACPWECDFGFFMDLVVVELDTNETGFVCSPCGPSVCNRGIEEFRQPLCLPTSKRADFCLPCPSSSLAQASASSLAVAGECLYSCIPEISYRSSADQQCKPCAQALFCPAGYRNVCEENPCVACPPLPKALWSSAVAMPSDSNTCQACSNGCFV